MKAIISKPVKNAMQSGRAGQSGRAEQSGRAGKSDHWVMEIEPQTARKAESLMGWISSEDTTNQLKMNFETLEEAKDFAEKKGWDYNIIQPKKRKVPPKNFGDAFKLDAPRINIGKAEWEKAEKGE